MYHSTRRPEIGTNIRLSRVSELKTRSGYAALSSSSPVAEGGATQLARIALVTALSFGNEDAGAAISKQKWRLSKHEVGGVSWRKG